MPVMKPNSFDTTPPRVVAPYGVPLIAAIAGSDATVSPYVRSSSGVGYAASIEATVATNVPTSATSHTRYAIHPVRTCTRRATASPPCRRSVTRPPPRTG